jgi:hypothetical protein
LGPPQGTEVLLDDRLGVFGVVGDYTRDCLEGQASALGPSLRVLKIVRFARSGFVHLLFLLDRLQTAQLGMLCVEALI